MNCLERLPMALRFFSVSGVLYVGFTMKSFIIGPLLAKTANNRFEPEVCRFSRKIFTFSEVSGSSHISEPRKITISVCNRKKSSKNIFLQGGAFDGTEKGPLDGTERGPLDGTAVCFSANFFRKRGASMVQRDFQKNFYA